MDDSDYILELGGKQVTAKRDQPQQMEVASSFRGRPWLAVHWKCCNVYSRVYRNAKGTAYDGRCPQCSKAVHVAVGPEGSSERFFEAY